MRIKASNEPRIKTRITADNKKTRTGSDFSNSPHIFLLITNFRMADRGGRNGQIKLPYQYGSLCPAISSKPDKPQEEIDARLNLHLKITLVQMKGNFL